MSFYVSSFRLKNKKCTRKLDLNMGHGGNFRFAFKINKIEV